MRNLCTAFTRHALQQNSYRSLHLTCPTAFPYAPQSRHGKKPSWLQLLMCCIACEVSACEPAPARVAQEMLELAQGLCCRVPLASHAPVSAQAMWLMAGRAGSCAGRAGSCSLQNIQRLPKMPILLCCPKNDALPWCALPQPPDDKLDAFPEHSGLCACPGEVGACL